MLIDGGWVVMRPSERVKCVDFPCSDVNKDRYVVPDVEIDPDKVKVIMVSEAPPEKASDYFYAKGDPFYLQTTLQAFGDAGFKVSSMRDVFDLGVYVTIAIKCAKTAYGILPETVDNCSVRILEKEIELFPKAKAVLLMGDNAIKAMNLIAKRHTGKRLIPSAPLYKIRKGEYHYRHLRIFPSYLQTGKSYLIEKSKQKMIAEDIRTAMADH